MNVLVWSWFAFTCLTALVWLLRHGQLSRAARSVPPLNSRQYAEGTGPLPTVTWLVAAKDEEANIGECLSSLAAQDYPGLRVVAVNDRSTDGTRRILDEFAARHPRLTAIHVAELRPGWFGKNNAMREGVDRADSEWLCFTDADCVHSSPRALTVAIRHAQEHAVEFLSVLPMLENHSLAERIIQPACGAILMMWFNPMVVNDPRSRAAYANGAFMLMTRRCYDAIGGHEAVRTEVNEDIHMARLAKERGIKLRVIANEDLYSVRMYESLAQIWAGWTRIFYGCFGNLRRLLLSAFVVSLFSLLPWVALAVAGGVTLADDESSRAWSSLAAAGAAACLAQLSVMVRFYALSRSRAVDGLLYPLGAVFALAALINAIRRLGGRTSTTWRGTTYRGDKVESADSTK